MDGSCRKARRGACVRACVRGEPGLSKPVALTLLKFIQAAGAAEGAHGGRLPAAASLHPRGTRPPSGWALHGAGSGERSSEGRRAEAAVAAAGARGSRRRVARSTRPPERGPLTPSAPRESSGLPASSPGACATVAERPRELRGAGCGAGFPRPRHVCTRRSERRCRPLQQQVPSCCI